MTVTAKTPSKRELKDVVEKAVGIFEPQVKIIYGGRGTGKTTALVAIDAIAEERGLRSLVIVPFSDMGKIHVAIKLDMSADHVRVDSSARSSHYYTVQRLGRASGVRPDVLLIEEWNLLSDADRVQVYRFWCMWRPAYTFVALQALSEVRNLFIAPAQFDYSSLTEEDLEIAPKGTPAEQVLLTPNLRVRPREERLW